MDRETKGWYIQTYFTHPKFGALDIILNDMGFFWGSISVLQIYI